MPRNDRMPEPRHGAFRGGVAESGAGKPGGRGLPLLQEHRALTAGELAELRRLAEEGRASGLSPEDGEALIDRLEARYRSLLARNSGS